MADPSPASQTTPAPQNGVQTQSPLIERNVGVNRKLFWWSVAIGAILGAVIVCVYTCDGVGKGKESLKTETVFTAPGLYVITLPPYKKTQNFDIPVTPGERLYMQVLDGDGIFLEFNSDGKLVWLKKNEKIDFNRQGGVVRFVGSPSGNKIMVMYKSKKKN